MSDKLSARSAIALVAGREIQTRARSVSFRAITAAMALAVVVVVLVFHFINRTPSVAKIGLTPQAAALQQSLPVVAAAAGQHVTAITINPADGQAAVDHGTLTALVTGLSDGKLQVTVRSTLSSPLDAVFTQVARQLALNDQIIRLGGNLEQVGTAVADAGVTVRTLHAPSTGHGSQIGMATVIGVLTYVMLAISIQLTGQGVIEEKANRIVELLLSTIRPRHLLTGKVLGIGVVTVAQVVVLAVTGAVAAVATGVLHLPASTIAGAAAWSLVWYILGYFLFALMMAAAASLVSRLEDATSVGAPLAILLVASYLIGTTILPGNPTNSVVTILSIVPFFAPVLMPMRIPYGVPAWQLAAAVILAVLTIALVSRLAGRIYRNAVLLTGTRVSLRTALLAGR